MAEQEQNRNEEATAFRLARAREKGSVPHSTEMNSLFAVLALLGFIAMFGAPAVRHFLASWSLLLRQAHGLSFEGAAVMSWISVLLQDTLATLAPLLALAVVAAIVSGFLQVGAVLSVHPVKPDLQRLNPMAGVKRLFSRRALFETVKNIVKLGLYGSVLAITLHNLLPAMLSLLTTDVHAYDAALLSGSFKVAASLLLALLAVALVDMLFSRRDYARQMMMSRRELKDEVKHREGDPKIKQRIRELQNEMRRKTQSMKDVGGADVLITNPTHLAVALSYRHGEMPAPLVVAKGAGEMVERMKAVARRHGVVIVENRPLARALYRQALRSHVPEAHYAQVARILIWVQAARRLRQPRSSSP